MTDRTVPDISGLDYAELNELRTNIAERMKDMRETGITQLKATIAQQAQILGVDLMDLIPKKARKTRKKKDDDET